VGYEPLVPATLARNAQGTPWSPQYGDVYHSADGGLEQARHVFIAGNGLPQRWAGRQRFTLLETGFGLGLNFLATWQAWRDDPQRPQRLHFVSIEKHPFHRADLAELHAQWPALAPLAAELQAAWPLLSPGLHRIELAGGRVVLTLALGDAAKLVPRLRLAADALYLDGFSPAQNPALWDAYLLKGLTRLCAPGATLATWSVAGQVREALRPLRWALEKVPGFGGKREMLQGSLHGDAPPKVTPSHALIIGAGLAGAAVADRLAQRSWDVDVLERHPEPAMEASGNPVGLVHPMLSADDNFASRIARSSFLYLLRHQDRLRAVGLQHDAPGVLQLARNAVQEEEQRRTCTALGLPEELVRFIDRDGAAVLAGHAVSAGGWHYPLAGWIAPRTLCRALLDQSRIRLHTGVRVARLVRHDDGWQALDVQGRILGEAPTLILANAHDAQHLQPDLPLTRIRGQITLLPGATLPFLRPVLCGNGYVTPEVGGLHALGATFDPEGDDPEITREDHAENLRQLAELLPGLDLSAHAPETLSGRVGFRTMAPDRLPLVGALPASPLDTRREARLREVVRLPGLHALLGLGSRGLLWSLLAGELLASQLSSEPLPLEGDLVDALDPARFLLRARKKTHEI
jgi:tRNA 5-methylaminomethyl-2-thiouridine biosynthesis bifunctional protein